MAYEELLFAADCLERFIPVFERAFPDNDLLREAIRIARQFAGGGLSQEEFESSGKALVERANAICDPYTRNPNSWLGWEMGIEYGDPVVDVIGEFISDQLLYANVGEEVGPEWLDRNAASYLAGAVAALFESPADVSYYLIKMVGWWEGWIKVLHFCALMRLIYSTAKTPWRKRRDIEMGDDLAIALYYAIGENAWPIAKRTLNFNDEVWEEALQELQWALRLDQLWDMWNFNPADVFRCLLFKLAERAEEEERRWQELHRELLN